MFKYYFRSVSGIWVRVISCLTLVVGGVLIIFSIDLRFTIIVSSLGGTCWLLLRLLRSSVLPFLVYLMLYYVNTLLFFFYVGALSQEPNGLTLTHSNSKIYLFFVLFAIRGLPPFPLFFSKLIVLCYLLLESPMFYYLGLVLLVLNVLSIIGYCYVVFSLLVNSYSSLRKYLLF
jgi:NADH:ubiquinone oxidoreductase subunit 2 (subunit N)